MSIPYIPKDILRKFISDHLFTEDGTDHTPEYKAFCDRLTCANYSGYDSGACFILGWSVEETNEELNEIDAEAQEEADAMEEDVDDDNYDEYGDYETDRIMFANPGSNSSLRAATATDPRNKPCPNCGSPNRLTGADVLLGYQCDPCADRAERGADY
jgi:hypothetical protein